MIDKPDNIKILILPFNDLTNQYKKEYGLEKHLTQKLNDEFKGILMNPRCLLKSNNEAPRYKKIANPYKFEFAENDTLTTDKNLNSINEKYSPDIIITGSIEVLEYTNIHRGSLSRYGSLSSLAAADSDDKKFFGFIGFRCEVINAHNNENLFETFITGISEKADPLDLSRDTAINKAIKGIDDSLLHFFSISER